MLQTSDLIALLLFAYDFVQCKFFVSNAHALLLIEPSISFAKEPETKILEPKEPTQQGSVLWKKWQMTKSLKDLTKSVMGGEIGGKEDHEPARKETWSEYHSRGQDKYMFWKKNPGTYTNFKKCDVEGYATENFVF